MYLVNGERREYVQIADRGLQYGDGLFETIEILNGRPLFFDRHLARLASGCQKLLIPQPDFSVLRDEALHLASTAESAILKLIVTRGCGGRGYRQPSQISPTRLIGLHPYPDYPKNYQTHGVRMRFCQYRLSSNPVLAGVKHLNRLDQILARAEWWDDDIQEGLLLDTRDFVVEGTMSNVFLIKDGLLYTPILKEYGVAGIVRQIVMELAHSASIPVHEAYVDSQAILQADEIFITNSVIGVWPVNQLQQKSLTVGEYTRTLQRMYNAMRLLEAQA